MCTHKFEGVFKPSISKMPAVKKNLIRAALNGIVYWVDNTNGDCYTYNVPPEMPTLIGKAVKDPFDPKTLYIQLLPNYKEIMTQKLISEQTQLA